MACLILIQYHKCWYSFEIKPKITEVVDLFNVSKVIFCGDYSLHTEHSSIGGILCIHLNVVPIMRQTRKEYQSHGIPKSSG